MDESDKKSGNEENISRENVALNYLVKILLLFFALQLYVSLSAVIFQRMEYKNNDYSDDTGNTNISPVDADLIATAMEFARRERNYNSSRFKKFIKVLNLQLNTAVLAAEARSGSRHPGENFGHTFAFMMSSMLLIGSGDFKPTSTSSVLYYLIAITFGIFITIPLVFFSSSALCRLYEWIFRKIKSLDHTKYERGCVCSAIALFILLLLCSAPFCSSNYLTGVVMAADLLTKTGNYQLRNVKSLPSNPGSAMFLSLYVLLGMTLLVIVMKSFVKKLEFADLEWTMQHATSLSDNCRRLFKDIRYFTRDEEQIVLDEKVETGEVSSPVRYPKHTFDPPVRSPMRPRLSMYNKKLMAPRSPLLVITEVTPDIHGQYVNKFEFEPSNGEANPQEILERPKSTYRWDSWEEFIHKSKDEEDEDEKSTVSAYSLDGSISSDNTDIEVAFLRRESIISDTNVVTDYPWLDSQVNILELTEENIKLMFGNGKADEEKGDNKAKKVSLSRQKALDFAQRKGREQRRVSLASTDVILNRKISKSDNNVNYSGIINEGERVSDTPAKTFQPEQELDGEDFTKSDFFVTKRKTAVRKHGACMIHMFNTDDELSIPACHITVDPPLCCGAADIVSADVSGSSDNETLHSGGGEEDKRRDSGKDLLDVTVIFPGNETADRRYRLTSATANVEGSGVLKTTFDDGSDAKADNFVRCFTTPIRSYSDVTEDSIKLIDSGDILYSDDETDAPFAKRQRIGNEEEFYSSKEQADSSWPLGLEREQESFSDVSEGLCDKGEGPRGISLEFTGSVNDSKPPDSLFSATSDTKDDSSRSDVEEYNFSSSSSSHVTVSHRIEPHEFSISNGGGFQDQDISGPSDSQTMMSDFQTGAAFLDNIKTSDDPLSRSLSSCNVEVLTEDVYVTHEVSSSRSSSPSVPSSFSNISLSEIEAAEYEFHDQDSALEGSLDLEMTLTASHEDRRYSERTLTDSTNNNH